MQVQGALFYGRVRIWSAGLVVSDDGKNLVSHAGTTALPLLADKIGLTGRLNAALVRRGFVPLHPQGRVLADIAAVIADGGETIHAIDVLGQGRGAVRAGGLDVDGVTDVGPDR